MDQFKHIDVKKVGIVTVANFCDQKILDDLVIQQLGEELFRLATSRDCDNLLLNFSGVAFLSSSALGKLITLDKKVRARGGTLRLCNIRPEIYEVFAITKLNRLFDIKDDESDALASF